MRTVAHSISVLCYTGERKKKKTCFDTHELWVTRKTHVRGALAIHGPALHYCHCYTGDSTVSSNPISINFINVPRQRRLISFASPSQMLLFASLASFSPSSVFQRFYSFAAAIYSRRHPSINTITTPARPRMWARLSQWNENN